MSVYKPFTTADLIVTPFEVNKSFSFVGDEFTNPNIGIERYIGKNIQNNIWISGSNNTGQSYIENKQLNARICLQCLSIFYHVITYQPFYLLL